MINYSLKSKIMKKVFFLSLIILLIIVSCAPQAEKPQVDYKAEEQTIRSISMQWMELRNNKDAAGIAALFADDAVLIRQNQQPIGPAAIQKYIAERIETNPKAIINWSIDRIEIATAGDLAIEYGSYKSMNMGTEGTDEDFGKYVAIYRKVNGTWKVSVDINQTTKPDEDSQ
jgi:uncharacterized protein (TIGR02246 family)